MSEVVFLPRRMSMIKRTWGELGLRLSLIKFKKCALLTSLKTRRRSKTKQQSNNQNNTSCGLFVFQLEIARNDLMTSPPQSQKNQEI